MEGASDTKLTSEEDIRIGSTFEGMYTYSGKTHDVGYEVVDFSPPNHFRVKSIHGPFPFESWIDLKSVENQTEVTNNIDAGSDHFLTSIMFLPLKPLLRRQMNKQMKKELTNLKATIENDIES